MSLTRNKLALLAYVRAQQPSGPRLVAFFGTIYYAGLRPEEAVNLGRGNITLPPCNWNKKTERWEAPPDSELPRVFRTGKLRLIHAASCLFRYSSRTSCGVR